VDGAGVVSRQVHGNAPVFSAGDIAHMDKSGTPYVPDLDQVGTVWNLLDSTAGKADSYSYRCLCQVAQCAEGVSVRSLTNFS